MGKMAIRGCNFLRLDANPRGGVAIARNFKYTQFKWDTLRLQGV